MARDVIITPASGLIDFQGSVGVSSATIELDSSGNLNIANPGGDLTLGDTSRDLYIGNGVANVDIIFEQDGEIRGLTGKTLTFGQSDSYISFAGDITSGLNVSGIVTALSFSGNASSATYATTAGVSTNVSGGTASVTQLNVSGVSTFQDNVYLGDNDKLILGDGGDLEIYHDGNNSVIRELGTGLLSIQSSGVNFLKYGTSEYFAQFATDGSVSLYYDNSKKFETIGAGVTITGTAYATSLDSYFASISNLNVGSFNATGVSTVGSTLDIAEYLRHQGDTNTHILLLGDRVLITAGGEVLIDAFEGTQDYVKLGDGGDVDINLNDTAFVDGLNSRVGIKTTIPTVDLDVAGEIRLRSSLYDRNNQAGNVGEILVSTGDGVDWQAGAPANAITVLTIKDEGITISDVSSISVLDFVGRGGGGLVWTNNQSKINKSPQSC